MLQKNLTFSGLLFNSIKIQPKTAREENRYPIFVTSEQGLNVSV